MTGDDREAEDVVQEAYVRAYSHLEQFEGRAHFATWLIRMTIHEAFARLRLIDPKRQAAQCLGDAFVLEVDHAVSGVRRVSEVRRGEPVPLERLALRMV